MAKRLFVLGAVFMLFAVVLAAPSSAAKPLYVEFDVTTEFAEPPALAGGSFSASGAAVDAGLMCDKGTKVDLVPEKWSPPPLEPAPVDPEDRKVTRNGQIVTKFTCSAEDGFGTEDTFVIRAQLHLDVSVGGSTWVLNWVMKDGTGAFEGLHGNGSGDGELIFGTVPGPPIGADDLYRGHLH